MPSQPTEPKKAGLPQSHGSPATGGYISGAANLHSRPMAPARGHLLRLQALRAAHILEVSRATVWNRMNRMGIGPRKPVQD